MWRRGRCCTGGVHAEAIASTTCFGSIAGAREITVGGRGQCAAVDDVITTVAFLTPFESSIDITLAGAEADTIFHGHGSGAGIGSGGESPALNIIPAH